MNTRLQVEHPVTEMVTGQDLVEWQLRVASGQKLPLSQDQIRLNGSSIEARIYSENPDNNFLPCTGRLLHLRPPQEAPEVRVETGVRQGDEVSIFYDPMIAKLVVWGQDRPTALRRMASCLSQYQVVGLPNNIDFLRRCVSHPGFVEGGVNTNFIANNKADLLPPPAPISNRGLALASLARLLEQSNKLDQSRSLSPAAASSPWLTGPFRVNGRCNRSLTFNQLGESPAPVTVGVSYVSATEFDLSMPDKSTIRATGTLSADGVLRAHLPDQFIVARVVKDKDLLHVIEEDSGFDHKLHVPEVSYEAHAHGAGGRTIPTPMPGKVVKVLVPAKTKVTKGTPLMILEAMKMEHVIKAPADCVLEQVHFKDGDFVAEGKTLITLAQ
eukprot:GILI01008604.1.p1 GENE.GILI01008604.1~~GILI01008604.1.p1  ORF type:complete len:384 (+),score=151.97 GILI01008604.1:1-1152(+)